nr:hypothetical protein [Tanacetum cinerariifolium]
GVVPPLRMVATQTNAIEEAKLCAARWSSKPLLLAATGLKDGKQAHGNEVYRWTNRVTATTRPAGTMRKNWPMPITFATNAS